jgi:hypothetical protein
MKDILQFILALLCLALFSLLVAYYTTKTLRNTAFQKSYITTPHTNNNF